MTKEEIVKCLYDYQTCVHHSCGECSAYQRVKFQDNDNYFPCLLFNIIQFGQLVKKENR